jgi:hypothetical protein
MDRVDRVETMERPERVDKNDRAEQSEALSTSSTKVSPVPADLAARASEERDNGLRSADVSSCDAGGSSDFGHSSNKHLWRTA